MTKYQKLGGLHTTNIYFSQIWNRAVRDQGAGKLVSNEAPLPSWLFTEPPCCRRRQKEGALWGLFCTGVNLILLVGRWPPYLVTSQRPRLLIPSPLELGFQHRNLRGDTNIQTIALSIHPLCAQCLSPSFSLIRQTWGLPLWNFQPLGLSNQSKVCSGHDRATTGHWYSEVFFSGRRNGVYTKA